MSTNEFVAHLHFIITICALLSEVPFSVLPKERAVLAHVPHSHVLVLVPQFNFLGFSLRKSWQHCASLVLVQKTLFSY